MESIMAYQIVAAGFPSPLGEVVMERSGKKMDMSMGKGVSIPVRGSGYGKLHCRETSMARLRFHPR